MEAEAGGLKVLEQYRQLSETLSQKKSNKGLNLRLPLTSIKPFSMTVRDANMYGSLRDTLRVSQVLLLLLFLSLNTSELHLPTKSRPMKGKTALTPPSFFPSSLVGGDREKTVFHYPTEYPSWTGPL